MGICSAPISFTTSSPLFFGICTSRKTRSGFSSRMAAMAASPSAASPITSTPLSFRRRSCTRILPSASSSTMSTRMGESPESGACSGSSALVIRRFGAFHAQLGAIARHRNSHFRHCHPLRVSRKRELSRRPIQLLETCPSVPQPDPTSLRFRSSRVARTVVTHTQDERVRVENSLDLDSRRLDHPFDSVPDRILDERLQDHARHHDAERIVVEHAENVEYGKAHLHDVEITIEQIELATKRYLGLACTFARIPQQLAQARDHPAYAPWIALDERRHCIECVEKKMRIELAAQRIEPRLGQLCLELRRLLPTRAKPE